jgi:hypothetical protein
MSLMRFALVARHPSATNEALAAARAGNARWETMSPEFALETLRSGDAALGRLDVLHTLDGVEDGLWALGALAARGVLVLNDAAALLGTHDKLLTAWLLRRAGVVHPTTLHVRPGRPFPAVRPPAVVKPRYGAGVRTSYAATTSARLWAPSRSSPTRVGSVGTERSSRSSSRSAVCGGRCPSSRSRRARSRSTPRGRQERRSWASICSRRERRLDCLEVNGAVEFTREYEPSGDVFADVASELARTVRAARRDAVVVPAVAV